MFSHITIGSNDIEKSKTFYDALLGTLGASPVTPDAKGRLMYRHNGGALLITKPVNGEPASGANGGTIGFALSSPEAVEAWHAAGIAHGGTTCEDPPGIRQAGPNQLYLAYLRDPDGNKLCGLHRIAA